MKTKIWIKEYGGWAWKIVMGITVACTWWMYLTFETKTDAKEHKRKYWENRTVDVKQVIDLDKRIDRLETRDDERRRRNERL